MFVKITRASKTDKGITIATNQFNNLYDKCKVKIKVKGKFYEGIFHNSRNRTTIYSESWDGPMPDVGFPMFGSIVKLEKAE